MKKRENTILEILSEVGRIEVTVLAERLGVSQVTVRKDLDALEQKGILRREHGYAVFGGSDDINNRLALRYEEKRRIAKKAASLVSAGETVMIENGSCCALLAEEIARTKPGATIVTNSAFIASYIRSIEGGESSDSGRRLPKRRPSHGRTDSQDLCRPILCGQAFCRRPTGFPNRWDLPETII